MPPTGSCPSTSCRNGSSYSLIEPLEWAGYTVVDIDGLTGLPEYRNGGLFLDTGRHRPEGSGGRREAACGRIRSSWWNGAP